MKNILIVEDDKSSSDYYKAILRTVKDYNIFSVDNTNNIFEYIKYNNIDLIFLDLKILPVNGFEIAKKIRLELPHIKIIAQTAYGHFQGEDKLTYFDLFLEKPIQISTILESIQSLLN